MSRPSRSGAFARWSASREDGRRPRRLLTPGRGIAASTALVLVAGLVTGVGAASVPAAATAAPVSAAANTLIGGGIAPMVAGQPGTPSDPEVLYDENFGNGTDSTPISLLDYTSTEGNTYVADEAWLRNCNGVVLTPLSPNSALTNPPLNSCQPYVTGTGGNQTAYNNMRQLAYALGSFNGQATPETNNAVTAYTHNDDPGANKIEFATESPIALPAATGRFITFSVNTAALNCGASAPLYNFALVEAGGNEIPVGGTINACTDGTPVLTPAVGEIPAGAANVTSKSSDGSVLFSGASLGVIMRNANGSGVGNDAAFDNIRILDATPQLDKSFSGGNAIPNGIPDVPVNQSSTLTFTVTNTSELAAKSGWSFTDSLPAGLVVADTPNIGGSCDATTTAAAGATDIVITDGNLAAGEVSCTITVDVTSDTPQGAEPSPVVYTNNADNITSLVGLNPPGEAQVEFYSTPELEITKVSDATSDSRPGDVVNYTVTATNVGTGDFTSENPAVVFDDLSGVLDDADYNGGATASEGAAPSFASPLLSWAGELPVGDVVVIQYSVTLKAGGDGEVRNVAWSPADPENPVTPACDPASEEGTDPATGEPCAENEYLLPKLVIEKSADRTDLPAVGEQVTYSITVTNPGPGAYTDAEPASFTDDLSDVLDDATLDEANVTASTGVATVDGDELSWAGALDANDSATITYTVTYTAAGNTELNNLACVPASEVAAGAEPCDTVSIPGARLDSWKSVAASDDPVVAGSVLTYTLHFENTGTAAATVSEIDHLVHVLDDADVTSEPVADAGLTAVRSGDEIAITGEVPAGETLTVTYTLTVKPDGERGDDIAANFLLAPEEEPPATPECTDDSERPDCTTTPIAAVEYSKSVEASETPVGAGTVLTYTVTIESTGTATVPVSREDVLTDVLDDATVLEQPVSDTGSVTVTEIADGRFQIGGELAAGETATVVYTVAVNDEDARGNNSADNFLVAPGEEPPAECVESDQCTVTPLPNIQDAKSVDPESGSVAVPGQELTYTLTFENVGEAAGVVDRVDDLTHVLDDADVTVQPTSSDPALSVSDIEGGRFSVTGSLEPGQLVTVTYTVTVKAEGELGDAALANFLLDPGAETPENPGDCEPGDADCTYNPVPRLEDSKTVNPDSGTTVEPGRALTYTLTFESTGAAPVAVDRVDDLTHVLDDADVTVQPTSSDPALSVSEIEDGRFSIAGELAPGQTVTVTYTVVVKDAADLGDKLLANFLLDPGTDTPPPGDCEPGDEDCTSNPVPNLVDAKSVAPESGTAVEPGQELVYTLTFSNTGQAPADVDRVDDLTHVLDDAEITTQPESSDPALTVSDVEEGRFSITGTLAPGQTVTVTYTVTVNAEGELGDAALANFLLDPGTDTPENPGDCEPGDEDCTSNPVPRLEDSKTVNPESGTQVEPGEALTYTLRFENTGAAPVAVDRVDDLTHVLDDADVTVQPTSSDAALAVSTIEGGRFSITGELAPGQAVQVTYTVVVKEAGSLGDRALANFLLDPGTDTPENPGDCEPGDEDCTYNPVPDVIDHKSVDPESGSVAVPGQELTYTLTFENVGEAAGVVDRVDDLTHVLDDADVTVQPTSSDPALSVSEIEDGRFSVMGSLEPGQLVTVTYTVTVKAEGELGDAALANFLLEPGAETPENPGDCEPGDADCTYNPVPHLVPSKTVDPASGTTVEAGDELTYTLSFENVGAAPATVDYVDTLTGVLDDAALTGDVVASEGLEASGPTDGVLAITGTVQPGETGTVTYSVIVGDFEEQGDHHLVNFLAPEGVEPPAECDAENPLCTENPVNPPVDPEPTPTPTPTEPAQPTPSPTEPAQPTPSPTEPAQPTPTPTEPAQPVPSDPGQPTPSTPAQPAVPPQPGLNATGGTIAGFAIGGAVLALLAGGAFLVIARRKRDEEEAAIR
ncbi:DUF7927 domain-containing protein [Microbacterium sp. NPDC055683]